MPCICWSTPSDEKVKKLKDACQKVADALREINDIDGHPDIFSASDSYGFKHVSVLIEHLYFPDRCKEKK